MNSFFPRVKIMTKKEKVFKSIKGNPKGVKFAEVQTLLKDLGFRERQPKGGSSHYIYYHESLDRIVTLTRGRKTLPEYQVKDVLRAIQRLETRNGER